MGRSWWILCQPFIKSHHCCCCKSFVRIQCGLSRKILSYSHWQGEARKGRKTSTMNIGSDITIDGSLLSTRFNCVSQMNHANTNNGGRIVYSPTSITSTRWDLWTLVIIDEFFYMLYIYLRSSLRAAQTQTEPKPSLLSQVILCVLANQVLLFIVWMMNSLICCF